jgi:two-component sensor histidine kinase
MTYWDSWTSWLQGRRTGSTGKGPAPTTSSPTRRIERAVPGIEGLRLRFLLIVQAALLPVAVLSVWQGVDRLSLDQENIRENLRQSAYAAASDEMNVFVSAEQLLRALSSEAEVRLGGPGCQRRLAGAVAGLSFFSNLGRVSADGRVLCVAIPPVTSVDATKTSWWKDVVARREFTIAGPVFSRSAGRPVLVGVLPLTTPEGAFDGTLNVAIDIAWLDTVQRHKRVAKSAVVALFDRTGDVIASNNAEVAKRVFADAPQAKRGPDDLLSATGPNDEAWSFAMAPLIRRDYFVGFAMPSGHLFRFTYVHVAVDLLLPVLMIVLASLAIWLATDRLAVKWIIVLQRMASAYRRGHYAIRPRALLGAPREFRALGETLSSMAQGVQERDKRLRDALEQKGVLIREVHHRVKNNLQIVMSLLSLQSSRLKDRAARDAIEEARTRVNALALVHRMIYELDRDGMVDLKALLTEVVEQLHHGFGGERRGLKLRLSVPGYGADADMAIPLTLFTIEALTNAYKHGFPEDAKQGTISVSLEQAPSARLRLVIEDDGRGVELAAEPLEQNTGARLMAAFANQVGGQVSTRRREGGGTLVELEFPDKTQKPEPEGAQSQDAPQAEPADGAGTSPDLAA